MPTLVIVDDTREFLVSASAFLACEGFDVLACVESGLDAVDAVDQLQPSVVLLDVHSSRPTGSRRRVGSPNSTSHPRA